jgi:hypothetical protein
VAVAAVDPFQYSEPGSDPRGGPSRRSPPGSHRQPIPIRVRDLVCDPADIGARMLQMAAAGVELPSPQRFGRAGASLARARDWVTSSAPRDRARRSLRFGRSICQRRAG